MLACVFFGDSIFGTLGIAPPGLYLQARDNKAWSAFLIFMVGNQLTHGLLTTGAFEVEVGNVAEQCLEDGRFKCLDMVNSELIFSKLAEGRFPSVEQVVGTLEPMLASSQ